MRWLLLVALLVGCDETDAGLGDAATHIDSQTDPDMSPVDGPVDTDAAPDVRLVDGHLPDAAATDGPDLDGRIEGIHPTASMGTIELVRHPSESREVFDCRSLSRSVI